MDYEAIFTISYYSIILGLFIFSIVKFVQNLKKPKAERSAEPTLFFVLMTIFFVMTAIFVIFILRLAAAYMSAGN